MQFPLLAFRQYCALVILCFSSWHSYATRMATPITHPQSPPMTSAWRVYFQDGTLKFQGNQLDNTLHIWLGDSQLHADDPNTEIGIDFSFEISDLEKLIVEAGAGKDQIQLDSSLLNNPLEWQMDGGPGDDLIAFVIDHGKVSALETWAQAVRSLQKDMESFMDAQVITWSEHMADMVKAYTQNAKDDLAELQSLEPQKLVDPFILKAEYIGSRALESEGLANVVDTQLTERLEQDERETARLAEWIDKDSLPELILDFLEERLEKQDEQQQDRLAILNQESGFSELARLTDLDEAIDQLGQYGDKILAKWNKQHLTMAKRLQSTMMSFGGTQDKTFTQAYEAQLERITHYEQEWANLEKRLHAFMPSAKSSASKRGGSCPTPGTQVVTGGSGNDILLGIYGDDTMYGNDGNDIMVGLGGCDYIDGGNGNDWLVGLDDADEIHGRDGTDFIFGGADDDCLYGEKGMDLLLGNSGGDEMHGGDDIDIMLGLSGEDTMYGGSGRKITTSGFEFDLGNLMLGGTEKDEMHGGKDGDFMFGNAGPDTMKGEAGIDVMFGNKDDDIMEGGVGGILVLAGITLPLGNFMWGNGHNDKMKGGIALDVMFGNSGEDDMRGEGLMDFIAGNSDNDKIYGGSGLDNLYGNGGNDYIEGNGGVDWAFGNDGSDTISGGPGIDWLFGDEGNDQLRGNDNLDFLFGGKGNDDMEGQAGIDFLWGGDGQDLLRGNTGSDFLWGQGNNDKLYGYNGADFLWGGPGNDLLEGENGPDILNGGDHNDTLKGQDGLDVLRGNSGDDRLEGGNGIDFLRGHSGHDYLTGGDGADILRGGADDDEMHGNNGIDILIGKDGNDLIYGGDRGDIVWGGAGNDTIYGGDGKDRISGNAGDDLVYAGNDKDRVWGRRGNDRIYGGADRDKLWGNRGDDCIFGEDGPDKIRGGRDNDGLFGGADKDKIRGNHGSDLIYAGGGDDKVYGNRGDDVIHLEAGNDKARGNRGADHISGGDGDDQIVGNRDNDLLLGGNGNDLLCGNRHDDILDGGPGNDELYGGRHKDKLYGGPGSDKLKGGPGSDTTSPNGSSGLSLRKLALCGAISGRKCEDQDRDGNCDPGAFPAGVTIYLDLNNNGVLNTGEPTTQTLSDNPATAFNEAGTFHFGPLAPGTYTVREVLPPGMVQVSPTTDPVFYLAPGEQRGGVDFANAREPVKKCVNLSKVTPGRYSKFVVDGVTFEDPDGHPTLSVDANGQLFFFKMNILLPNGCKGIFVQADVTSFDTNTANVLSNATPAYPPVLTWSAGSPGALSSKGTSIIGLAFIDGGGDAVLKEFCYTCAP